jgi:hypothetical protein
MCIFLPWFIVTTLGTKFWTQKSEKWPILRLILVKLKMITVQKSFLFTIFGLLSHRNFRKLDLYWFSWAQNIAFFMKVTVYMETTYTENRILSLWLRQYFFCFLYHYYFYILSYMREKKQPKKRGRQQTTITFSMQYQPQGVALGRHISFQGELIVEHPVCVCMMRATFSENWNDNVNLACSSFFPFNLPSYASA